MLGEGARSVEADTCSRSCAFLVRDPEQVSVVEKKRTEKI